MRSQDLKPVFLTTPIYLQFSCAYWHYQVQYLSPIEFHYSQKQILLLYICFLSHVNAKYCWEFPLLALLVGSLGVEDLATLECLTEVTWSGISSKALWRLYRTSPVALNAHLMVRCWRVFAQAATWSSTKMTWCKPVMFRRTSSSPSRACSYCKESNPQQRP